MLFGKSLSVAHPIPVGVPLVALIATVPVLHVARLVAVFRVPDYRANTVLATTLLIATFAATSAVSAAASAALAAAPAAAAKRAVSAVAAAPPPGPALLLAAATALLWTWAPCAAWIGTYAWWIELLNRGPRRGLALTGLGWGEAAMGDGGEGTSRTLPRLVA